MQCSRFLLNISFFFAFRSVLTVTRITVFIIYECKICMIIHVYSGTNRPVLGTNSPDTNGLRYQSSMGWQGSTLRFLNHLPTWQVPLQFDLPECKIYLPET